MAEEAVGKATGGFNTPVEFWVCANPPKYQADRFHTYRNCPNNRDLDTAEREKQSIQEYSQLTLMKGGIRGDPYSQWKRGQIYSIAVRYMFAERRVQITCILVDLHSK